MKILLFLLLPALAPAQMLDLKSLDRLNAKASDTVDVKLDGSMLQMAAKFLSADKPDEAGIRKLIAGLTSVTVRTFEFEEKGQYGDADIDAIRAQLVGPQWSRVVSVRSRKDGENTDIFLRTGTKAQGGGVAIISAEPKELSIVQILGAITIDDIRDLAGNFGIPEKLKKDTK